MDLFVEFLLFTPKNGGEDDDPILTHVYFFCRMDGRLANHLT